MVDPSVLYAEPEPGLGVVTLHRPDRLNAMSLELVERLHERLDFLERPDTSARVVILTGAGRGFCAGTDLRPDDPSANVAFMNDVSESSRLQRRIADLVLRLRRIPQPVIAAVNGVAAGGGFSLTMAADIRLADPSARFIASFANIGLSGCEMGSSYFLPRLIGFSRAAEILYTGRAVDAVEAERWGYVSRVTAAGAVVGTAVELAKAMLAKAPFGLRMTKEVLNQNVDAQSLEAAVYLENRTQTLATRTEDFAAALVAFMARKEKTAPAAS